MGFEIDVECRTSDRVDCLLLNTELETLSTILAAGQTGQQPWLFRCKTNLLTAIFAMLEWAAVQKNRGSEMSRQDYQHGC